MYECLLAHYLDYIVSKTCLFKQLQYCYWFYKRIKHSISQEMSKNQLNTARKIWYRDTMTSEFVWVTSYMKNALKIDQHLRSHIATILKKCELVLSHIWFCVPITMNHLILYFFYLFKFVCILFMKSITSN